MKLYKFRSVDTYSLTGLANNVIWFSGLQDFNDPFEGSYQFNPKEFSSADKKTINQNYEWRGFDGIAKDNIEKHLLESSIHDFDSWPVAEKLILTLKVDLESIIKTIHNSKAVCLSRQYIDVDGLATKTEKDTILDNLMWSHYSSGLRGFCLVFDDVKLYESLAHYGGATVITPISYREEPATLELKKWREIGWSENPDYMEHIDYVYQTIASKSKHWEYEKEIRFVSTEISDSKRRYCPSSLIEIVIGEKMPLDQQKLVINTAKDSNPNIKVKLAKLKSNSYELEIVNYPV